MSIMRFKIIGLNGKAQSASTLTWVVAFVLIFFLLAMFILFASGLAAPKKIESAVKGVLVSDVRTQEYQTYFTNSYALSNLDKKVEYNSKQVSLREVLEGYALKEYSKSEVTKFIQLLNKKSFVESNFIYSTFYIDDDVVYFYGDSSCTNVGRARVFLPVATTLFKIDVGGSICGFFNSEQLGGEPDASSYT